MRLFLHIDVLGELAAGLVCLLSSGGDTSLPPVVVRQIGDVLQGLAHGDRAGARFVLIVRHSRSFSLLVGIELFDREAEHLLLVHVGAVQVVWTLPHHGRHHLHAVLLVVGSPLWGLTLCLVRLGGGCGQQLDGVVCINLQQLRFVVVGGVLKRFHVVALLKQRRRIFLQLVCRGCRLS